uniref:protein-tyrosine-phosphatase n=1 Tax=Odontella aurita TaxID=265563 RepID=A0A7S4INS7_9STRA|mmetsp:Transcript_280/g.790  ORF Transcript_280/g.790 Transcript_280/m.790 type:complete len:246 (+) Transcript_280:195-932(+)
MDLSAPANHQQVVPWAWIKCVRDLTDPNRNSSKEPSELPVAILPWLMLSDRKNVMNMANLKRLGVTHILSVNGATPIEEQVFQERLLGTGIVHKRVFGNDSEDYDMVGRHWQECHEFLRKVKDQDGGRVVVHCVAGINRSGLIACAAHMVLERESVLNVVRSCVSCRGMVLWNRSFQEQLCRLAVKEHLLGDKPIGYNDEPIVEVTPPPPPAHEKLQLPELKFFLSSHLSARQKRLSEGSTSEEW